MGMTTERFLSQTTAIISQLLTPHQSPSNKVNNGVYLADTWATMLTWRGSVTRATRARANRTTRAGCRRAESDRPSPLGYNPRLALELDVEVWIFSLTVHKFWNLCSHQKNSWKFSSAVSQLEVSSLNAKSPISGGGGNQSCYMPVNPSTANAGASAGQGGNLQLNNASCYMGNFWTHTA